MHWLILLQIFISVLYVGYLIYGYALKGMSLLVKVSVYFTWLLCFGTVVLLPYDVYETIQGESDLTLVWRTMYGSIFLLTWVILPIGQEYEAAGEFGVVKKIKRAAINNLITYGIFGVLGAAFLAYLIIEGNVNIKAWIPVLMAISNAFGMFLVVIFLSYGVVTIPKSLWRHRKYEIKLKELQFMAKGILTDRENLAHELELKVKQVLSHIKKQGESFETNCILSLVPTDLLNKLSRNVPDLGVINPVSSNREVKELTVEMNRLQSKWDNLCIEAFRIQDILRSINSSNRRITSTMFKPYKSQFFKYWQWMWHCRIKPFLSPIIAVIFSIVAVGIILAEFTCFIPQISFISPFPHILALNTFMHMNCSLLAVMGYMAFCVYFALFKLKLSNLYGLYWGRHTDAGSLIFFSINCSRVSNALCYNFLQIIHSSNSAFLQVMGETNVIPIFGVAYKIVFPLLMILMILCNAFNAYGFICRKLNLNKFQFQKQFTHENIQQGRQTLQKVRESLEKQIVSSNCQSLEEFRTKSTSVSNHPTQCEQSSCISTDITNKNTQLSPPSIIHLKNNYFNQYPDMEVAIKVFDL